MSLTKLVIPRKLWGKGALLNKDGTMCCLGHASKACGVPESYMRNYSSDFSGSYDMSVPRVQWEDEYGMPHWMIHYLSSTTTGRDAAIAVNDSDMPDERREAELIEIFKDHGIELVFEGEK